MYQSENFYILRVPTLSVDFVENLLNVNNEDELYSKVIMFFESPRFKDALYLASPVLYSEIEKLRDEHLRFKKRKKLLKPLLKYIIRSGTRSTPFGLFSGISLGYSQNKTNINLSLIEEHVEVLRLDMGLINEIILSLTNRSEISELIKFYPNNSYYRIKDKINYFENEVLGNTYAYSLTSVDCTEPLLKILKYSEKGLTKLELIEVIVNLGYNRDESIFFINELIENKIIQHNLFTSVTGQNALTDLTYKIKSLNHKNESTRICLRQLLDIQELISSDISISEKKESLLIKLKRYFDIKKYKNNLFQVDLLIGTANNNVSQEILNNITSEIVEIMECMPPPFLNDLEDFKNKFNARYENQELPLTHILDNEYGIGYGDSNRHLIGKASLVTEVKEFNSISFNNKAFKDYDSFLASKLFDTTFSDSNQLNLNEKDIENIKQKIEFTAEFPNNLYALGSLIGTNATDIDKGEYNFLLNICSGPSSSTLISRFSHIDKNIYKNIKESIRAEEPDDDSIIYAEIVHTPQPSALNIIHRPVLRNFEIPYISSSGIEKNKQINVNDLLVTIRNNEVILRSKKLNKRIIPRLTTAHNFTTASLPIYKFLCDLQFQGKMCSYKWNWRVFSDLPVLPRVVYKKIILSPLKWNISLNSIEDSDTSIDVFLSKFIKKYKVPNKVLMIEGDNQLLINIENNVSYSMLTKALKKNGKIELNEYLLNPSNCFIKNSSKDKFANELILLLKKNKKNKISKKYINDNKVSLQREFSFGDEWLYFKLYGGNKTLDNLLYQKILKIVQYAYKTKLIDLWFFIRYNDPDFHIRLRFHLSDNKKWHIVVDMIKNELEDEIENKSIYKIQLDNYQREVERYGGDNILISEKIFSIDSIYTLQLLKIINKNDELKWLVAFKSIFDYFNYFEMDVKDIINFADKVANNFYIEFGNPSVIKNDLNILYRKHSDKIIEILNGNYFKKYYNDIYILLDERHKEIKSLVIDLEQSYVHKHDNYIYDSLLPSYIHMSINRLFSSYQRKYEMILYHFLGKGLNSVYQRGLRTRKKINSI